MYMVAIAGVRFSAVNLGQGFPSFPMPDFAKQSGKYAPTVDTISKYECWK